jgi:hypothetical protein
MMTDTPKGWFVEMLEQIATQPALLKAAAAGEDEWDQRRRGRVGFEVGPQPSR